jgi:hypothetical protein
LSFDCNLVLKPLTSSRWIEPETAPGLLLRETAQAGLEFSQDLFPGKHSIVFVAGFFLELDGPQNVSNTFLGQQRLPEVLITQEGSQFSQELKMTAALL